ASPARLEEAWIGQAPRPVAEPYESPQDGLLREIDALRKSQDGRLQEIDALRKSRSWRVTAPLRTIAQSVRRLRGDSRISAGPFAAGAASSHCRSTSIARALGRCQGDGRDRARQ